jgi:hypothetical protein
MPVGTRIWKDVDWDGQGRRGVINTDLGSICRYMYPGMASVGGLMRAARSWDDWGRKTYADQGSCQDAVWRKFWELYRLPEGVSEQVASVVFHNSAQKVVKDAIKHARFQSIAYNHMNVLKQPMNARQAKALNLYLQKEGYVQGIVDWLVKDAEAWESLCEHWASPAFVAKSERARQNRLSKWSVHHYGADGHVQKVQRMKASTGVDPHFIDVWVPMHRDDPEATQKLDRYTEEMRKTHGPNTDPRSVPFDVNAAYHAGRGLLWAMGYRMFQVIVESPMSPPPAPDLKAPKLKWATNCDKPKSLCSSYCKAIMLCSIQ